MIINPSMLAKEQMDALHAIYDNNEEAIGADCGHEAQYAVENNLLRSIFGEEAFRNAPGNGNVVAKEGRCLQCLHYDRMDGAIYCRKMNSKVGSGKCACNHYIEW